VYDPAMRAHIRKNVVIPRTLDDRLRTAAKERGSSQSGLIVHLIEVGLAAESGEHDALVGYLGLLNGPADLSETIDKTVYGR
jgi:hypothetical protein